MAIDMEALRAKAKQRNATKKPEFIPSDLNEGNVQAIYNRCLATEEEKEHFNQCNFCTIFYKSNTGMDSGTVCFSKDKISKNRKNIEYLFGQLLNVHEPKKDRIMTLQDAALKYDKTVWTSDLKYIFMLLNLAYAVGEFPTFTKQNDLLYTARYKNNLPTLSPKDPAFPAWWETHKSEWED